MGGATNKFFTLLSATTTSAAPTILLRHRFSSLLFLRRRRCHTLRPLSSPSPRRPFHSRAAVSSLHQDHHFSLPPPPPPPPPSHRRHPWPEWSRLLDNLAAAGYFHLSSPEPRPAEVDGDDDLLLATSPEFSRDAAACLRFARERPGLVRLLSRRDMEVVIGNVTPSLFKSPIDNDNDNDNVGAENGKANTITLMKFILSFVSSLDSPLETSDVGDRREVIGSSVRKLLSEMGKLCYVVPDSNSKSFGPVRGNFADREGESMRQSEKIEMKKGDWNCPRCSFMNFARNTKCIECEASRPKTVLTGGEWECPQCDFFNNGRNVVCMRCDFKRTSEVSAISSNTRSTGYDNAGDANAVVIDRRLAENEEKAQRWFSKISQMDSTSDINTAIEDDDFPEIMPLRKGVNRFVVSTRKTPLERRLANSQTNSAVPSTNSSSVSPQYDQSGGRNSTYVPFVPLPADMFAKKPENIESENMNKETGSDEVVSPNSRQWASNPGGSDESEAISQKPLNRDESNIMPMRKGENRFVVGKKKDRSLISPAYKRQMAMEQASDAKFVPFVPFPPDYFAKKDDKPPTVGTDIDNKDASKTVPNSPAEENFPQQSGKASIDVIQQVLENFAGIEISGKEIQNKTPNSAESPLQPSDDLNIRENLPGKSLEGSAVKEPDPLDMSEEAKAERWFRRVAQIKDISELSQIPDEDFPSIMPMRKGVNRFVVSKRKTPLERRLTSPQYKRNLPVSSDPVNNDIDNESS